MQGIGKFMIIAGVILVIAGVIFMFAPRIPFLGKLPGDILIKRENFTFYFPWATSIILSILLTLIMYLIRRFQ